MRTATHGSRTPIVRAKTYGFTLVEVLVAMVVLAFGLLGMVGLQAASLQANRDARLQAVGVNLAKEVAEMLRGNKNQAILATSNPYLGSFTTSPLAPATPNYCLAAGNTCADEGATATAELTDWLARVDAELPGARVSICRDTAPYDANGLPQWTCTSASPTDVIVVKIGWVRGGTRKAVGTDAAFDVASRPSVVLPVTAGSTL